jgi:hypothetical protein
MNYFTLLGRLLLIVYSIFLLLLSIGEGLTAGGWIHAIQPVSILLVVTILWNNPLWSALATFVIFLASMWFFKTYEQAGVFLIVSVPLAIASILFLIGTKIRNMA